MFKDRTEAGLKLAEELKKKDISDGIIMAIPRGGVVLAAKIREKLGLPVDLIIPRKLGAPLNPEMAVGAVTQDGKAIYNHDIMSRLGLREKDMQNIVSEQVNEIKRRMKKYRGRENYPDYSGKEIVLVDDGIATGATVLAAIKSLYRIFKPRRLILAVPVAPPEVLKELKNEVDDVVCILQPEMFMSVGQFYDDFDQVEDKEVMALLNSVKR